MKILDAIHDALAEVLILDPSDIAAITPETRITDLGAESLDGVEIALELEEALDIEIPADLNLELLTISQLIEFIESTQP